MKKTYKVVTKYLKVYFDWMIQHQIKGVLSIVGMILLLMGLSFLITPKLKKQDVNLDFNGEAKPVINEIDLVSNLGLPLGEIEVFSNDSIKLYLNTETANVRVVDLETNTSWNTTYNSTRSFDKLETYEIEAMSLMNITYYGYDNSSEKWNTFENSVMNGTFKANEIEDGVQLIFDVEDRGSVNLFEYIPQEISRERYEELFVTGIENADFTAVERNGVETSIEFVYRYNEEKDNYYYRLSTAPQLAMVDYLILAMEKIEYTKEDLISDNTMFGIETVFVEKPHFEVTMEFTVDGSDLIVNVPTEAIVNLSPKFEIVNIEVLPNFGGADYRYKEGYTFVPDGSGAIMNLDSYNETYPKYSKPVYNNNLYFDIYNEQDYSENIEMPIFGMTYKKGGTAPIQGFLSIIESGEELAYINSQVSDGYSMNQSYSSFDTVQSTYLKVFGPYSLQSNVFRSESEFHNFSYQVRYKLLLEEDANYYQMSQIYKSYLVDKHDLKPKYTENKIHLDVLGSVSMKERFLGIPYEKTNTYTNFSQLDEILNELNTNASVKYLGVLNGGVKHDLLNKVDIVKSMETDLSYNDLLKKHNDIYTDVFLSRSYSEENGMRDQYAMNDFYGEPVSITQYNAATKQFETAIDTSYYNVVSPSYLQSLTEKYLKETKTLYSNVSISDLGSTYYADYNRNSYVSAMEANDLTHSVLSTITKQQNVIMSNPFIEFIKYNDFVTDISHESSKYGGFSNSIPFKQLVLNGIMPFTTENMNHNTAFSNDYFLLQYCELGALPKFFISYEDTVDLKVSEFNYYYSIQFETYKTDIRDAIKYIENFDKLINDKTIVGHEIVSDNIYKTIYKSGEEVYVNYNDYNVVLTLEDDSTVSLLPYGYYID